MQLVSFNFIFSLLEAISNNSSLQFHTVEGLCQCTVSAFTLLIWHTAGCSFSTETQKLQFFCAGNIKICHLGRILNLEVKFNYEWLHKFKAFVLLCKLYVRSETSAKYVLTIVSTAGASPKPRTPIHRGTQLFSPIGTE